MCTNESEGADAMRVPDVLPPVVRIGFGGKWPIESRSQLACGEPNLA